MSKYRSVGTKELVNLCIINDQALKRIRREVEEVKAELQSRGVKEMEDHNVKFVRYYTDGGSVSITESLTLDILNPDKLRETVGEGVWATKVRRTDEVKYKCNAKFEQMLKAVFTGDYTFEMTLDELLGQMDASPEQRAVLKKKLKGDFKKDQELLRSVLDPAATYEEELWYIYKIKNAELIRAFLPEELLDLTLRDVRKCILVEDRLGVTIEYEEE